MPGTDSSVTEYFQKKYQISCFRTSFSVLERTYPVLKHLFPVLECTFLLCPALSRGTGQAVRISHCPVLSRILTCCPGSSCSLVRF